MSMPLSLDLALELTRRYCAEHHPSTAALVAGSIARGTATPTSDIDIVLIFEQLDNAWRETAAINGITAEFFAHDLATLGWFFDQNTKAGHPTLAAMVAEGVPVTSATPLVRRAKELATAVLAAGPPPLSAEELADGRYIVTDLAEDLRGGGTPGEMLAVAARLYETLAGLTLRAAGHWSGIGKAVPRRLELTDPDLALRFEHAFGALFRHGHAAQVLGLVEELLAPLGGPLAAGYRRDAPATWRKA
jgi:predicted nucleotidyltransferase